ncbi:hypothetical protein CRM22_010023 [Opisthorchis felineus]|uniref:Uncharacterized protein n=1 Tax=Opisthorchis felineus TaxID=147828 RepID=A0A4V3SCM7_OPIFE|nr:hypothetical protein CRM22_010023 [Opisthorchis felineus]TGZ57075.1 hypothetical protein CRM22_010023 [Opisthorchis felineus]
MFLTYFTFILVPHLLFYQGASAQFYNEACVAECTRNAELCLINVSIRNELSLFAQSIKRNA